MIKFKLLITLVIVFFFSPLDQFLIIQLGAISTILLYVLITFLVFCTYIYTFFVLKQSLFEKALVLLGFFLEALRTFITNSSTIGNITIFSTWSLCVSLLMFNLLGLLPLSFTVTTHLIVSLCFSTLLFLWINSIFFFRFFIEWGSMFLPSGTPITILFLIVPIELLSYFSRILSLSIRLFANMLSGHTLLFILSVFMITGFSMNILIFLPVILLHAIFSLEIGVAVLQAYVFTTLILLYLNDVLSFDSH